MVAQASASALCACGCGKPQRPTSNYASEARRNRFSVRLHRARQEILELVAAGEISPEDAILWTLFPHEMARDYKDRQLAEDARLAA
jgi:hypothetical protein